MHISAINIHFVYISEILEPQTDLSNDLVGSIKKLVWQVPYSLVYDVTF